MHWIHVDAKAIHDFMYLQGRTHVQLSGVFELQHNLFILEGK
jgi:hypothetical protein